MASYAWRDMRMNWPFAKAEFFLWFMLFSGIRYIALAAAAARGTSILSQILWLSSRGSRLTRLNCLFRATDMLADNASGSRITSLSTNSSHSPVACFWAV